LGVTDNNWFRFLSELRAPEEVNFWHPSGVAPFGPQPEGMPFLFKLKAPNNHIAGGGFLVKFESLPLPLVWDAFGDKNGAASYSELVKLVVPLRRDKDGRTPEVGCSILAEPFFWPRSDWIDVGSMFPRNIVSGKFFDSAEDVGAALWGQIQQRLRRHQTHSGRVEEVAMTFGAPRLVAPRRGQGAFRALVTNAYQRTCALTGEHTLPVLEAAHIKPFSEGGPNNTYNGLLLRSDFHKLFDIGLVTVTRDHRIEVSRRIHDEWYNGKAYSRLHGARLALVPSDSRDRPSAELLDWHNQNCYEKIA